jgi:hypothetical protein
LFEVVEACRGFEAYEVFDAVTACAAFEVFEACHVSEVLLSGIHKPFAVSADVAHSFSASLLFAFMRIPLLVSLDISSL